MTQQPAPRSEPATPVSADTRLGTRGSSLWMAVGGLALAALMTANFFLMAAQRNHMAQESREHAFWRLCHPGATPQQRTALFLQLTRDDNTEWRSAALDRLQLSDVALPDARLQWASLTSCELLRAQLTKADLTHASFDLSDLSEANFSHANLRNASLFMAVLADTDFRNADMLSASLEQAQGHGAKFIAAKMGDAFLAMSDFTGAEFTGADLSGANLEAANLTNTDLALANLFGADLTDTNFTNSNWWRSRGLTTQQLDRLIQEYPPSDKATESRLRDFKIWITRRTTSRDASN